MFDFYFPIHHFHSFFYWLFSFLLVYRGEKLYLLDTNHWLVLCLFVASLFKSCFFDNRIFVSVEDLYISFVIFFLSCLRNPALPWPLSNVNQRHPCPAPKPPMTLSARNMKSNCLPCLRLWPYCPPAPSLSPGHLLFLPQTCRAHSHLSGPGACCFLCGSLPDWEPGWLLFITQVSVQSSLQGDLLWPK